MTPATPKSFAFLSREEAGGVVLYRQSRLTTHVLRLDARDRLWPGSRFRGRLFPERCDLSPEGRYFVYFAMRGTRTGGKSDPATWTAVCEPPDLHALVFCPNGSTWGGGGLFLKHRRLILFDAPEGKVRLPGYRILADSGGLDAAERLAARARFQPPEELPIPSPVARHGDGPILVRILVPRVASGYGMFRYELRQADGGAVRGSDAIDRANWAGWDARGRLLAATGRHLHIFNVSPGKPLGAPKKTLDLDAALAAKETPSPGPAER